MISPSCGEMVCLQVDTLAFGRILSQTSKPEAVRWRRYREPSWNGASSDAIFYGRLYAKCLHVSKVPSSAPPVAACQTHAGAMAWTTAEISAMS
ncbi:hypothetical protein OESDEN_15093 [Oesophagostomum dentatum]|uniref:Uncharacterized protein n=1 Tax=Oesophagostomum dentatum TaxID=61180 RepID=A0A0B1SPU6_OESDE|nr:hypothetical protein OESDEN_15093 [Oesophagostomum dentatum]